MFQRLWISRLNVRAQKLKSWGLDIRVHQGILHAYVGAHAPASGVISAIPRKGG
jgi:hypothetical protein